MITNSYSPEWFSFFLDHIRPEQTEREVEFIERYLDDGSLVLDSPCGSGRHARLLAARGHQVVGLDRDPSLLGPAADSSVAWICADLRAPPLARARFDAILCLWQSFGYFGAAENAALLRRWAELVRPRGRLILDIYHRAFFESRSGERALDHPDGPIRERTMMEGDRLVVELEYEGLGGGDRFEWQLFTPEEFAATAGRQGWDLRLACSGFDPGHAPDPGRPRVQYVLERLPGLPDEAEEGKETGVPPCSSGPHGIRPLAPERLVTGVADPRSSPER
jgi:SAM-dependent methyltransferase